MALGLAYWATPVAIRLAARLDFYDKPLGYKGHARPTPYLGGAAVVAAFTLTLLVLTGDFRRTLPLVAGVLLLWAVGTVDDRRQVAPGVRVAVELGIAFALWALGLGWELGAGPVVNLVVTAFWIVAVVNAFNLFDNMDGAAGSMACVVALGLALLGAVRGDAWLAVAAASLAGACLGFLPHNLFVSPARIFLGDGGSMPIGFSVAALAMIGMSDAVAEWQSLAMGLLFVGIPALDTALVVISRTRNGVSILQGGRDHLTHRTRARVQTARAVAATLGAAQAIVSVLALVALEGGSGAMVAAVGVYLVGVGVTIAVLDREGAPAKPIPAQVPAGASAPPPAGRRRSAAEMLAPALLVPVGVIAGLSPFAQGYYASKAWVPGGLVLVVLTTAVAIARPVRLQRPAQLMLGALAGLGALSLASSLWADSASQAFLEGARVLVYAVALGAVLLLARNAQARLWLVGSAVLTAFAVAGVVLGGMLGDDPSELFLGGRLDQPLGYINGEAAFFMLAMWPCVALAESRRAWLAGAGAACAVLLAGLLVMSQSRGIALATAASLVIVLAVVPGRVRRAWVLGLVGLGVGLAAPPLLDVYAERGASGRPPASTIRDAAVALLLAAALAGALWAMVVALVERGSWSAAARRLPAVGVAAVAVLLTGAALVKAPDIARTADEQYTAFVRLAEPRGSNVDTGSRLVSGAGNRYDYWRVAWSAWKDKPVLGWGAGGYDVPYFQRRATVEDIRQPHSIELQALAELGIAGLGLLLLLAGGAAWAVWRAAGAARRDPVERGLAVAATGIVVAWAVHTSVDWLHLLPGVTALAIVAAGVLATVPRRDGGAAREPSRPTRLAAATAVAVVLAVTGGTLVRQAMTDHFRHRAETALAERPADALRNADRALRLDPASLPSYYVKAAALARFGEGDAARATLTEAARREPGDFVTWALLGDLATRQGDEQAAQRYYGRALALNPKDPALQASARAIR